MSTLGLPVYPGRGQRRALDSLWLAALYRDGLARYMAAVPQQPTELKVAIQEFNGGKYWRCHETLEQLWLRQEYPVRLFYHGLLKAAVGLLHLERRNRRGAGAKLEDARYTLGPFLPTYMGVETDRLLQDVDTRLAYLHTDGRVDWLSVEELPQVRISIAQPIG